VSEVQADIKNLNEKFNYFVQLLMIKGFVEVPGISANEDSAEIF
jgi:hypothetical protein